MTTTETIRTDAELDAIREAVEDAARPLVEIALDYLGFEKVS